MYFSTTKKTTEPCPISSSSIVTSSLISTSDSNPISDDSTVSSLQSYGERSNTLKLVTRSTLNHSNDYYTSKRIEELHERMDDIQIASFLKFINYHLSLKNNGKIIQISDLSNGIILIDLIEILSLQKLKRERGHTRFHSLTNIQYVLDYLKQRMDHIDISPYEILSGNRKQTLALLWIIMKIFDFPSFRINDRNCLLEKTLLGFGQDRSITIHWLNNILNHSLNTQETYIRDFYFKTWTDGYYLSIIIKYLIPLSLKYSTIECFDYVKELNELTPYDKARLHLCLIISNYCFNTIAVLDFADKTEISLFKYFTQLQQHVFDIIKANQIGKLIQNNSYAKQVLDIAIQTRAEHSKHSVTNDEQYLSCIEDDHQQASTEKHTKSILPDKCDLKSSNVTVESSSLQKSKLLHDKQHEIKLSHEKFLQKTKHLQSNSHMANTQNGALKQERNEVVTYESQNCNGIVKKSEQFVVSAKQAEQQIDNNVKVKHSTVQADCVTHSLSTIEQSANTNEKQAETIVTNINGNAESSISDIQEWEKFLGPNNEGQQAVKGQEAFEHTTTSHEEIQQSTSTIEQSSQSIILNQHLPQTATAKSTNELIVEKQTETIVANINENAESSVSDVQEWEESFEPNDKNLVYTTTLQKDIEELQQQSTTSSQDDEQFKTEYKIVEEQMRSFEDTERSKTLNEEDKLEKQEQIASAIEQNVQYESSVTTADQPTVIIEEQKQVLPLNEHITETKSPEDVITIIIEDIPSINMNEQLEQSTMTIEGTTQQQMITSTIENIEFKPSGTPNKETMITHVEHNHTNTENNKLEQSSIVQLTTSVLLNEENLRNTINVVNHENSVASNETLEQSIVEIEEIEQFSENNSSVNTNNLVEQSVNIESIQSLSLSKVLEQTVITNIDNDRIIVSEKLEQHTAAQSVQGNEMLHEKTRMKSMENYSPSVTSKKLEKPTVIELPQPIPSNEDANRSIIENQKFIGVTKTSTQSASSFQEHKFSATLNEQLLRPTSIANQSERHTFVSRATTETAFKGDSYASVVRRQSPKPTNEPRKPASSLKKQESSIETMQEFVPPVAMPWKPRQYIQTNNNIKQFTLTSTIRETQNSDIISVKKQEPIKTVIEERSTISVVSNVEDQILSQERNTSNRSGTGKRKSRKQSADVESSLQHIEKSLPSSNTEIIVSQQQKSKAESEIKTLLTTDKKLSVKDKSTQPKKPRSSTNSQSLKRKNEPKSTTTPAEKLSSPIVSTPLRANRNAFVIIRESIQERKILGFACVFILIVFAFMLTKAFLCNYSFQRITAYRWLSKTHQPSLFEPKWASIFAEATTNSYLSSPSSDSNEKPFVMLFPPPNVTGTVHLGHALTASVHDCLLRWHAMQKKSYARCIPGYDHAGIATQVIVEKHLAPRTREDLGREKFLEECYRWSSTYRQTIETQLKRLCPLFDWPNAYFTMDRNLVENVRDSFLRLYDDGLIYRDRRIVNWCCKLQSVVSDIEVDSKEINGRTKFSIPGYSKEIELGVLYNIAYRVIDEGQNKEIIVSTTRPETILADTGIAVHPMDPRYSSFKNKFVQNPFDPQHRLPIIFDERVDQNFGTGAVKLTPGHDAFDYALAIKHKLEIRTMLNDQGYAQLDLNHPFYHQLNSLHRYDAREKVLQLLENQGLRRGEQEQPKMIVPVCSRTGDIIEPMIKEQWFLDTNEMSRQASAVVENNTLKLTPPSTRKVWKYWLDNTRPWCLSRQLWWGHSIPMYRCSINGNLSEYKWIGAKSLEEAKQKATLLFPDIPSDSIHIEQDQDVLDTWFSSGLLPMSVCNKENSKEFPTALLETGYDIMFFWVARMVMLSLKLTNQLPFHEVLFHGLICDPNGKKMSKSLGNIIDPMDVINGISLQSLQARLEQSHLSRNEIERAKRIQSTQYPSGIQPIGSDGLRLFLLSYDIFQQAIRFDPAHFDYVARYCNKVWNAYKYVTEFALADMDFRDENLSKINYEQIEKLVENRLVDRWMLNELNKTIGKINESLNNYTFHLAVVRLRDSFIKDFCDFYIEFSKIPIKQQLTSNNKSSVQILLYYLLKQYLILYHPFLPAMTEELWQDLTHGKQGYLIHQSYPSMKNIENINSIDSQVIQIIRIILKNATYFKQMLRLSRDCDIIVYFHDKDQVDLSTHIETYLSEIRTITRMNNIHVCSSSSSNNSLNLSKFSFRDHVTDDIELIFNLHDNKQTRDLVEKHEERLSKQVSKLHDDIDANDTAVKYYQENNDLENVEREQRRNEILLEEIKLTQQRHERFVEIAQKRTIVEKKKKNA
ncbi:unnamed protein product [Rotaria socialis]|nr:unnamed protein product [Rotaria socialis]